MNDGEEILLDRVGGIATLTINRPQALNALTLATIAGSPRHSRPGGQTRRCMRWLCGALVVGPFAPAVMCVRFTTLGAGSEAITI